MSLSNQIRQLERSQMIGRIKELEAEVEILQESESGMLKTIATLEGELAAARADTEMLDWLLDGMDVYGPVYALRYHPRTRYANRQAITKAMEESKERFCKQLK